MSNDEGCKVRVDDQGHKLCFLAVALNPTVQLLPESTWLSQCDYPKETTATCPKLKKVDTNKLPDLRSIKRKA